MGKTYNYYDTPYNHPETKKYRKWETAILIFGIGVVSTLLILNSLLGNSHDQPPTDQSPSNAVVKAEPLPEPHCDPINHIHVNQRNRLIQLLKLATDLPIEYVTVNQVGTVCYDQSQTPTYDLATDIRVTIGYIEASYHTDYEALGNHVATLLPPMMQIHPDYAGDLVIRFLVDDTYLEWSRSYDLTALNVQGLYGEELWFWAEPEY